MAESAPHRTVRGDRWSFADSDSTPKTQSPFTECWGTDRPPSPGPGATPWHEVRGGFSHGGRGGPGRGHHHPSHHVIIMIMDDHHDDSCHGPPGPGRGVTDSDPGPAVYFCWAALP